MNLREMFSVFSRGVKIRVDFNSLTGVPGRLSSDGLVYLFSGERFFHIVGTICLCSHSGNSHTHCFASVV